MSALFSGPIAHAIGWALVHLLWQGVLVAGILAAALALMQKQSANARYLAACGALVLLVALGVATAIHVYEPPASAADMRVAAPALGRAALALPGAAAPTLVDESPTTWQTAIAFAGFVTSAWATFAAITWFSGRLMAASRTPS